MISTTILSHEVETNGYTIIEEVYSVEEIRQLISIIASSTTTSINCRHTDELFAIRQFLKELPALVPFIFNERLKHIISTCFGDNYFLVKSIYFDKPPSSNWFVAYHQDITVSVSQKFELPGFSGWLHKQDQYSVQPPLTLLQNNFTIRIHLDDTTADNGALHVMAGSHTKGVIQKMTYNMEAVTEQICTVKQGGIMLMRPLLLHASGKTISDQRRRVIHLEFSHQSLPEPLRWSEFLHYGSPAINN